MAYVDKCDNCGVLNDVRNPVKKRYETEYITGQGIKICIDLPSKWDRADLCQRCVADFIRSRFAELCGMLMPYQPTISEGDSQALTIPIISERRRTKS